jgi:hypothetical protein
MAEKETVEVSADLIQAVPHGGPVGELNVGKFAAIQKFAAEAEQIGKALDTVRKFVLGRAFPGDWVRFGDKIEMGGAAADRILSSLGLMGVEASFTHWQSWKDTGTDKNGSWFVWYYKADVRIGGLLLEGIEGRAGSRDRFFGYANGAWKDLSDVKESDIRVAARRGVIKEGIKVALGLRSIPANDEAFLRGIGLDPSKIKTVEFGSGGAGNAGAAPAEAKTPLLLKHVGQRKMKKKDGSEGIVYVIEDEKGAKYETFSEGIAKSATEFWKATKKVLLDWEPNGKYAPKLKAISEADASGPDPEPGAEQA